MTTIPVPGDAIRRDPERTREEILGVALREFARHGYAGARVDEIAAKTRTTKRMIYYYFGGKKQLYIAALERAYSVARSAEQQSDVMHLDPVTAIRRLAELTFDHHESHPDFIQLVSIENIHRAEFLAKSRVLSELSTPALAVTASILERGYVAGAFRRRVEAIDLHMMISAFCFFRMSNRYTFGTIFGCDLIGDLAIRDRHRQMLGDLVVGYLTSGQELLTVPAAGLPGAVVSGSRRSAGHGGKLTCMSRPPWGRAHPQGAPGQPERRPQRAMTRHHASPIRYPPSRTVWMTGGSPSMARSRKIVCLTAVVKGSANSSQTRSSSSSAETTRPAEASRYSRTANSLALSARRRPARATRPWRRSASAPMPSSTPCCTPPRRSAGRGAAGGCCGQT